MGHLAVEMQTYDILIIVVFLSARKNSYHSIQVTVECKIRDILFAVHNSVIKCLANTIVDGAGLSISSCHTRCCERKCSARGPRNYRLHSITRRSRPMFNMRHVTNSTVDPSLSLRQFTYKFPFPFALCCMHSALELRQK